MDASGGVLLRRVARDRVRQVADELREPFRSDPDQALSVTLTQGDPATAQQALVEWLDHQVKRARREGRSPEEARRLLMEYYRHRATIHGLARAVRTELGLLAECVDEDYGRDPPIPFKDWCTRENLVRLFDIAHGSETNLVADKGQGKTHLKCLLGQLWTTLGPRTYVFHNISGLRVEDPEEAERWFHVRYLSDIIRHWTSLPIDAEILLLFDEPGQTIEAKAGGGSDVEAWNKFRPQLRKMNITVLYGWQWMSQIFKRLRDGIENGSVPLIEKLDKKTMVVQQTIKGKRSRVYVQDIPPLDGIKYDTRGWTLILPDIQFHLLVLRTVDCQTPQELRSELEQALRDPEVYTDEYRSAHFSKEQLDAKGNAEVAARMDDVRQMIRDNPSQYTGVRGYLTPASVWEHFGPEKRPGDSLTQRQCGLVARELNDELGLKGRR